MLHFVRRFTQQRLGIAIAWAVGLSLAFVTAGQALVTFESLFETEINSGTSVLLIKPTGTVDGNLLIAVLVVDDDGNVFNANDLEAPTGWTLLDRGPCPTTEGGTCAVGVWWKIASGEPSNYVFDWVGGSTEPAAAAILRYSGTDTSDPIGVFQTASGRNTGISSDLSAPSITTAFDNSVVLRLLGNDRLGPYTSPTNSHTALHSDCNTSPDPNKVCLAIAEKDQATAGAAGNTTWSTSASGTNIYWRSLSIEIIPPQPQGSILVSKQTLPPGTGGLFDFTTSGADLSDFGIPHGGGFQFDDLAPGTGLYSITETVPNGWTRIAYCDVGFPGNIEVVDGLTTECVFVNVDESQIPRCDLVGPADSSIGAGSLYSFLNSGVVFDALAPFVLRAVDVYPETAGNVVVNLKQGGTLLATRSVWVSPSVAGEKTRIALDLPVPAGSGYELDALGTTAGRLYRNTSGGAYPYTGDFVDITGSTIGGSFYYFFYDWEVERMDAVGASSKEFGGGSYHEGTWKMFFDTTEPTRIHSVHVYPEGAGDVSIELLDAAGAVVDSVVQTVSASLAGAKTPIALDFLVPAGSGWALRLNTTVTDTKLWRNSSGSVYPFSTSSLTMTGNSLGNSGYYYYFFDWLFTPARVGWEVRLHDLTLDGPLTVRACESATLGPDLDLEAPADVDVDAGSVIVLESPTEVKDDVLLGLEIDPSLLPD